MFCDANNDLGYQDYMFTMLGGNVDDYVSLGYLKGYDPSIDPYCVNLDDLSRKITWIIFFNPFYDFSNAFDKVFRILITFGVILAIISYLVFSELWSQ